MPINGKGSSYSCQFKHAIRYGLESRKRCELEWYHSGTVMEAVSIPKHEEEGAIISSLPDFAEIFMFLQNLGPYMKLSNINLIDLENFFREGKLSQF